MPGRPGRSHTPRDERLLIGIFSSPDRSVRSAVVSNEADAFHLRRLSSYGDLHSRHLPH